MGRRRQGHVTAEDLRQARAELARIDGRDNLFWLPEDAELEQLPPTELARLMDRCIVAGYHCPVRPILSAKTITLVEKTRRNFQVSDFEWASMLRSNHVAKARDLDGAALLALLAWLERRRGLEVSSFVEARRTVTRKQIQLLQAARKQVRSDFQALYHGKLVTHGGVNTTADLDERGVELMMAFLENAGFVPSRPAPIAAEDLGHRPGFATPAQLGLIRELWLEWSGADDEAALATWLERSHQVSALRFLTSAAAGKAITALKAMKRRRTAEASGGTAA